MEEIGFKAAWDSGIQNALFIEFRSYPQSLRICDYKCVEKSDSRVLIICILARLNSQLDPIFALASVINQISRALQRYQASRRSRSYEVRQDLKPPIHQRISTLENYLATFVHKKL